MANQMATMQGCCCVKKTCTAVITIVAQSSATCTVEFNSSASASSAVDCPITGWLWNFGDGTISEEPNPTHTFGLPNRDRTITLTIVTECGCTASTSVTIPEASFTCPSNSNCPVTSLQSLPEHWLATFSGMPSKPITDVVSSTQCQGRPVSDPSNRFVCTNPVIPQSYYSTFDYSSLNRSYEVPGTGSNQFWQTGDIILLRPYWTNVTATQCIIQQGPRIGDALIAKITIGTTFNCNSRGTFGNLSCEIEIDLGVSYIGRWFTSFTLPPNQLLKDQGPITLPPVRIVWSGESGFLASTFPYSDPCGFPAIGSPALAYATCVLTPNG